MRKVLLALAVCILAGSVAKADSFTISGPVGTLPVSTFATIDLNASVTTVGGGVFTIVLTVAPGGPDAGQIVSSFFGCGPGLCTFSGSVAFANDGLSGTDVIDGTLSNGLTSVTSVTWGGGTTPPAGTPEPGTLTLLAAALAGPLALRRRMAK